MTPPYAKSTAKSALQRRKWNDSGKWPSTKQGRKRKVKDNVLMMFSLENIRNIEAAEFFFGLFNVLVACFFVPMFYDESLLITKGVMLWSILISVILGWSVGLYYKYRSKLSSLHTVGMTAYMVIVFEIIFFGSGIGFCFTILGRPDLRWLGFTIFAICMFLTLLLGMLLEAKRLGLLKGEQRWRDKIGKFLNFEKRLVKPTLTARIDSSAPSMAAISFVAAIGVNVPLMIKTYTGDMNSAAYIVVPGLMATFAYVHLTSFGPGLLRVLLLMKIEKELGFRFENTHYAEVQRMRHDFWEASKLMRDYDPEIYEANRRVELANRQNLKWEREQMAAYEAKQKKKGKR